MEWLTFFCDVLLVATALVSSRSLFRDHRAPSVGFFLLGMSVGLGLLGPSWPSSLQAEAQWAGEVLAPGLVTFHLLWLSEDRATALLLLGGCCLLPGLGTGVSSATLQLLNRCAGLIFLSCSLTVCLCAGSVGGALGGASLCLPLLLARHPSVGLAVGPAIASEGTPEWLLKLSLSLGCWASAQALPKFLSDLTDRSGTTLW